MDQTEASASEAHFFGPRELDQAEQDLIQALGIQYYSSEEINRVGAKDILEAALNLVDPFEQYPIHLSFDVDLFDQRDMMATGTRVQHGPKKEEVFLMGGLLAQTGRFRSMDLVEFNPMLGGRDATTASASLISDFMIATVNEVFTTSAHHHCLVHPEYLALDL